MLGVNAIQRHEVAHAREIHTGARDIIETLAGRLENRREILEDALRFGRNTSRHQLARRRVLADLTAEIDETTDFDRLGKRANRRREFQRGNCGLAHGKLLWILWLDGQNGGARGCARFQCLVGVCSILERKALIDVNAHLSRSHHLEQLLSGSFKRIASLYVVEEDWARQKQRTLLRQQNGRNGIDGTGGLAERHHQSAWS